jgi:hypothetical protein
MLEKDHAIWARKREDKDLEIFIERVKRKPLGTLATKTDLDQA